MHLRRLAHNGELYGRQFRQYGLYAVLARYFFFAGSQINQVVCLCSPAKLQEHLQQAADIGRTSGIPVEKLVELLRLFYEDQEV